MIGRLGHEIEKTSVNTSTGAVVELVVYQVLKHSGARETPASGGIILSGDSVDAERGRKKQSENP